MMDKNVLFRDDRFWHGHPDVALFNDKIYVVCRESARHKTNGNTAIRILSFPIETALHKNPSDTSINAEILYQSPNRLNCPRLSVVEGNLTCVCDEIQSDGSFHESENSSDKTRILLFIMIYDGKWSKPIETNITGIVPDKMIKVNGSFLIASHTKEYYNGIGRLVQYVWKNEKLTSHWERIRLTDYNSQFNFCEASIYNDNSMLICLLRENSQKGLPAFACFSDDYGDHWSIPRQTRLFGCHRPVLGKLKSNKFLVTYREASHIFSKYAWARNTFAALITESMYMRDTPANEAIILPIDHDDAVKPDSGYTGWVEIENTIFVVNYITKQAPLPYIAWYRIHESDFCSEDIVS